VASRAAEGAIQPALSELEAVAARLVGAGCSCLRLGAPPKRAAMCAPAHNKDAPARRLRRHRLCPSTMRKLPPPNAGHWLTCDLIRVRTAPTTTKPRHPLGKRRRVHQGNPCKGVPEGPDPSTQALLHASLSGLIVLKELAIVSCSYFPIEPSKFPPPASSH